MQGIVERGRSVTIPQDVQGKLREEAELLDQTYVQFGEPAPRDTLAAIISKTSLLSLDRPQGDESDEEFIGNILVADPDINDPSRRATGALLNRQLAQLLWPVLEKRCDLRSRCIMRERLFAEEGEIVTLEDLGNDPIINSSRERVRQIQSEIENEILGRLKMFHWRADDTAELLFMAVLDEYEERHGLNKVQVTATKKSGVKTKRSHGATSFTTQLINLGIIRQRLTGEQTDKRIIKHRKPELVSHNNRRRDTVSPRTRYLLLLTNQLSRTLRKE